MKSFSDAVDKSIFLYMISELLEKLKTGRGPSMSSKRQMARVLVRMYVGYVGHLSSPSKGVKSGNKYGGPFMDLFIFLAESVDKSLVHKQREVDMTGILRSTIKDVKKELN